MTVQAVEQRIGRHGIGASMAAAWRRDVAPTSGIVVRSRKHVPATGLFAGTDAAYGTPQSRGSCW